MTLPPGIYPVHRSQYDGTDPNSKHFVGVVTQLGKFGGEYLKSLGSVCWAGLDETAVVFR
jgi:hypothetical protein